MILFLRVLAVVLLAVSPFAASSAQDDGSDLDRLSESATFSSAASDPAPQPLAGRICNGVETGSTAPCPPPDAPPVPLDGGLSLLAVAGAAYAAKRLRARRA